MDRQRINRLQAALKSQEIEALLVTSVVDLYYLLGLQLSVGKLIVSAEQVCLFVDPRYIEQCQKQSPVPVCLEEKETVKNFLETHHISQLSFDSQATSFYAYQRLASLELKLLPTEQLVARLRMIKDENELEALREASALGTRGYLHLCDLIKEGVSEKELQQELDIFWKRAGGEKMAFDPIISFGERTSLIHSRASDRRLKCNEAVLIDIGVVKDHYCSDMTRTVFFGEVSKEMENIHSVVHEAFQAALKVCCPGSLIGDLDREARAVIEEAGFGEYFTHALGHGVGLEVHENPAVSGRAEVANIPLEKYMVITIEPGVYISGVGGVRIEDTIVITDTGYESLTNCPSKAFTISPT